jgi:acyl carrier protein
MDELIALIGRGMGISFPIEAGTPLISSGIVDSLRVAELLTLLEARYRVAIEPSEVGVDNFDTPDQIFRFLQRAR